MKMQVVTTITTLVDIDTLETTHSVDIFPDDGIPESVAKAVAVGACRSTLRALGEEA